MKKIQFIILNFVRKVRMINSRNKLKFENKKEKGVLYIVFGDKNMMMEAIVSIHSIRIYNKSIPILVYTDDKDFFVGRTKDEFLEIRNVDAQHKRSKVDFIGLSPFEKTLYLDSDTIVLFNVDEMFEGLSHFDILFTPDFSRKRVRYSGIDKYNSISSVIPEINGGVMAFNDSEGVKDFFSLWRKNFYQFFTESNGYDQISMRIALASVRNIKPMVLPGEYNMRPPQVLKKLFEDKMENYASKISPKIIHRHFIVSDVDLDDIDAVIQKEISMELVGIYKI